MESETSTLSTSGTGTLRKPVYSWAGLFNGSGGLRTLDDWTEVTDQDEDGNIGDDGSFLWSAPNANVIWLAVVGRGTDGTLGP